MEGLHRLRSSSVAGPSSSSSGGGADGGPGHVDLSCNGVPSGGSGAVFLAFQEVL